MGVGGGWENGIGRHGKLIKVIKFTGGRVHSYQRLLELLMKYVKGGKYFFNSSQAVMGKKVWIWSQILGLGQGINMVRWHLNEAD